MINYNKHLTKGCFTTKGNRTQQFVEKYKTDEIDKPLQSIDFVKILCKDIQEYSKAIDNNNFEVGSSDIIKALDITDKYFNTVISHNIASIYIDPAVKNLIYKINKDDYKGIAMEIPQKIKDDANKIAKQVKLTNIISYNYEALLEYMTSFIQEEIREYKSNTEYESILTPIKIETADFIYKNGIKGTVTLKKEFGLRHDMQLYRLINSSFKDGKVKKYVYIHTLQNLNKRLARYYISA